MRTRARFRMVLMAALALSCTTAPAWGADATAGLLSGAGPTFTIAAPKDGWTLIAYGDMRFTDPRNTTATNPEVRRALVAKVAAEKPDALLLSGDVPLSGGVANDYAVYRAETAAWRAAGLKVFPAMGNHELKGSGGVENWWNAFPELRGRRWYSVQMGEAYCITVDSNLDLKAGGVQSAWVAKQLEGLPKETSTCSSRCIILRWRMELSMTPRTMCVQTSVTGAAIGGGSQKDIGEDHCDCRAYS